MGQSVARYEDQSLIVETTHLLGSISCPWGNKLTDLTTMVETYIRLEEINGRSALNMDMIITFGHVTKPWVLSWQTSFTPNYEFVEQDCDKLLAY